MLVSRHALLYCAFVRQILQMESMILNTLSFRLAVVTPKHFMKRFTTAAGSNDTELQLVNVRCDDGRLFFSIFCN